MHFRKWMKKADVKILFVREIITLSMPRKNAVAIQELCREAHLRFIFP